MKRSHIIAAAFTGLGLAAVAAACGFPDETFNDTSSALEAGADSTPSEAAVGSDTSTGADAGHDSQSPPKPDVDPDGSTAEAGSAGDAAVAVDASGCGTSCDCDHDGYIRIDDAGCDGGGGLGPDCDDYIAAINPGAGIVTDPWPNHSVHPVIGDWNCDGTRVFQYNYNATCGITSCADGFATMPACGTSASYNICKQPSGLMLLCSVDTSPGNVGTRIQGCQ